MEATSLLLAVRGCFISSAGQEVTEGASACTSAWVRVSATGVATIDRLKSHTGSAIDALRRHVAPGDGHPQRGARLCVGARGGGETRDAMAGLAVVALGRVQRDRAESGPELFREIPIVPPDLATGTSRSCISSF